VCRYRSVIGCEKEIVMKEGRRECEKRRWS